MRPIDYKHLSHSSNRLHHPHHRDQPIVVTRPHHHPVQQQQHHTFLIDRLKPTPSAPAYEQMPLLPPPILTNPALPDMPDIDQLYPGPKHTVGTAGAKKVQHQIKKSDIKKLQGRKWLNDVLVQFGLDPHPKGIPKNEKFEIIGKANYKAVAKWTKHVDIFKKKYIVIPINEDSHWYFLVILNPENLLSHDTESPPVVLVFDSLLIKHEETCRKAVDYLINEAKNKLNRTVPYSLIDQVHPINVRIPKQPNSYDCGLYVIHCFQKFFTDVDGMMRWINDFEKKKLTISPEIIWDAVTLSEKRNDFYNEIFQLIQAKEN
ncbi:hypothetical protein MJO29_003090 [Puccinia striiformis f. sp. tritici]|nr:hypothetical protein MJO29_003090 [Puccinia striiformis f. sp. tritici]